jgi:4-amino-4-deoxy-L-arabinose transferase-like glycosyltransferase
MNRRDRVVLGAVLAVALVVRVGWCVWAARLPAGGLHDPNFYYLYSQQLANGNGFRLLHGEPTAYYPPGYVFSLTPFIWLGYRWPLDTFRNVQVAIVSSLNIVWQLLTIGLAFEVARRVSGRAAAGYVAAGVLALWPNLVFHTAVALTESLFLFLLLAALVIALPMTGATAPWSTRRLVLLGAVLGAATLVRPVTVPVFPILFLMFLVARTGWRRALRQTAIVTGVAIGVLVPWVVRNAIVMDAVTLSTNTGDNLCMSRHVGGTGGFELEGSECFSAEFDALERPEFEIERELVALPGARAASASLTWCIRSCVSRPAVVRRACASASGAAASSNRPSFARVTP